MFALDLRTGRQIALRDIIYQEKGGARDLPDLTRKVDFLKMLKSRKTTKKPKKNSENAVKMAKLCEKLLKTQIEQREKE